MLLVQRAPLEWSWWPIATALELRKRHFFSCFLLLHLHLHLHLFLLFFCCVIFSFYYWRLSPRNFTVGASHWLGSRFRFHPPTERKKTEGKNESMTFVGHKLGHWINSIQFDRIPDRWLPFTGIPTIRKESNGHQLEKDSIEFSPQFDTHWMESIRPWIN